MGPVAHARSYWIGNEKTKKNLKANTFGQRFIFIDI